MPASKRTVTRARERQETKQYGRPLTPEERGQAAISERAQFQAMAHRKAIEFKDIIVGIRDEMVALLTSIPIDRKHKAERQKLDAEISDFNTRVRGARAFVIDTGLQLIDGIPNNPAEPPLIETPPEKKIIVP